MKTTSISPVFQVHDLAQSLAFYRDVLGFTEDFAYGEPPFYAGVRHGDAALHLCSSEEGKERRGRGAAYLFCDEVDAYYAKITAGGAEVTSPLRTQPYGLRDFQIKDRDGNLLSFGVMLEEEES